MSSITNLVTPDMLNVVALLLHTTIKRSVVKQDFVKACWN